ncbi:MAG: VanW family protein [Oscillospiraceae bacterium]|nr:VanW family protein [Oscillospiraceae bacterium]
MLIVGICAAVLALLIFLGAFFWGKSLQNSGEIFPNVCVSGVNVGGMDQKAAEEALEESLAKTHAERILTVQLPDRKLVFDPQSTNTPPDAEAMAAEAMAYGRSGGALAALKTYLQCRKSAYILDAEEHLQVDTDYIRQLIEETAEDVAQEKVQSEVTMDEEKELLTIKLGYNGRKLDVEKLYETVINAYTTGDLSDIRFSYDIDPYDIVDLQPYYDEYCTPARNAYYNKAEDRLMPEVVGYGFDIIAVNAQIALAEEGSTIEVQLGVMEPTMTAEEYNTKNYPDVLASYQSAHTYNTNRTTNLTLACREINGTVLQPGEVFSFNNVVGERTIEKGYKEGIIYADGGESEMEEGGGICQVVSSVYMCALTADLQIVERQPHMYPVGYVKPGCDATVYWGAVDFKFKNSNSTPIKINAEVSGGYVKVSIVGTNEHDYKVTMSSQLVETIPYEEVEKVDATKPAGYRELEQAPHTGYVYWSYKNFYDLNGVFLRTEKCAISEYTKYDAVYIVGAGAEEEEEKEVEEEKQEETPSDTKPEEDKKPEQNTNTNKNNNKNNNSSDDDRKYYRR